MLQKISETPNPNFAGNKPKETKPKFEMPAAKKDTYTYERRKPRHIKGALEDPNKESEKFQLNDTTVNTLKTVLLREYKYCDQMVKTYATTLAPVMEKVRLGQALTPADEGIINSAGLRLDQFQFYIDFRSEGASSTLDTDAGVLARADGWRKRDDRLLRTLQLAEDQLAAFQSAANADVASRNIKPKQTPYETEGPHIFGDEDKPVTMAELKKRTNIVGRVIQNTQQQLNDWMPGRIAPNEEALLRRGVQSREGIQRLINESDPHYYYDGVKFYRAVNGQVQLVTRGPVELRPVGAYGRFLLQAESVPQILISTREMKQYEKHITDLVDARIDIYRNVSDREHIEPKVYNLTVDPHNPNRMIVSRNAIQNLTDIEREFANNPDEQRRRLQERIQKETQDELRKKQEERQKTERNQWLGEHVKQWKTELGQQSARELEENAASLKKLQESKKLLDTEKTLVDQIDTAKKNQETAQQKIDEVVTRTKLDTSANGDLDMYVVAKSNIRDLNNQLNEERRQLGDLRAKRKEYLQEAQQIAEPMRDNRGQIIYNQNGQPILQSHQDSIRVANAIQAQIDSLELNISSHERQLTVAQGAKDAILAKYTTVNLTEAELDGLLVNRETVVSENGKETRATNELTQFRTTNTITSTRNSKDLQTEIAGIQNQIDTIGKDRIEDGVVEMLDTFEKARTDETGRNTRLQGHEHGTLADIPDYPHLAGYPRVYLRTIQILFPDVSFAPDKQADLMKFMKLFPPEDFVRIAGPAMSVPRFNMYSPGWNTYQDTLMTRINSELLNNIMDDLSNRIRRKDLGLTAPERAVYETNVNIRNTYEASPIMPAAKDMMRQIPGFQTDIRDLAESMYYYESTEDLARRYIAFTGRTITPNRLRTAYFMAEEIIQYRKEHPNI